MEREILEQILETLRAIRAGQVEELEALKEINKRLDQIGQDINLH